MYTSYDISYQTVSERQYERNTETVMDTDTRTKENRMNKKHDRYLTTNMLLEQLNISRTTL